MIKFIRNVLTGSIPFLILLHPYFILRLLGFSHSWIQLKDIIGVFITECFLILFIFLLYTIGQSFYDEV